MVESGFFRSILACVRHSETEFSIGTIITICLLKIDIISQNEKILKNNRYLRVLPGNCPTPSLQAGMRAV
jgi:dolichol kinase